MFWKTTRQDLKSEKGQKELAKFLPKEQRKELENSPGDDKTI